MYKVCIAAKYYLHLRENMNHYMYKVMYKLCIAAKHYLHRENKNYYDYLVYRKHELL